jgi:hypothetical protein
MKTRKSIDYCLKATTILLLTLGAASPAFAYVDPGTGAMLFQMMMAAVGAAIFYFRSGLSRIAKLLPGRSRNSESNATETPDREQ